MITTGSKFLIGAAVLAVVSAIAYGVTQDGVMGTIGLVSAAVALSFLAGVNVYTRDCNYWADEIASLETAPAAVRAPADTVWPFAFALSATVIAVGLVTVQAVFVIGVVLLLVSGAEWAAEAWAQRASGDPAYNAEVRNRMANPLEFPVGAAIAIGIVIFAFSRIMLGLSKTGTTIMFSIVGALIITLAYVFAAKPGRSKTAVAVVSAGALVVIAGGAVAGFGGEREIEEHETTAGLNEEGVEICTSTEKFKGDEKASQSIGNASAAAATITLGDDGELTYRLNGPSAQGADGITLPRSNPNNIVFRNESSDARRLSVDLGTRPAEEEGAEDEEVPYFACTSLVEEGGAQNITLIVSVPSLAFEDGYSFFVPGVESARLNLFVP
jgi:hypothetical protein